MLPKGSETTAVVEGKCFGCGQPHPWSKKEKGQYVVCCPNAHKPGIRDHAAAQIKDIQARRGRTKRWNLNTVNWEDIPSDDHKSPRAKLGENSQNPGTAELTIVSAGLNAPAYWNGIRLIFDTLYSALNIDLRAAEAIQIGRNYLTFPMVNQAAPA